LAASIGGIGALVGIAVITLLAVGSLALAFRPDKGLTLEEARPVSHSRDDRPIFDRDGRGCADVSGEYLYLSSQDAQLESVPKKAIFQYIYFQTPTYLNMTLAVGMALGSSLALSRIARESELTAIRATGVRILRTIAPVIGFGVVGGVGDFYLAEKIMPGMSKKATQIGYRLGFLGMTPDLKTNAVVSLRELHRNIWSGSEEESRRGWNWKMCGSSSTRRRTKRRSTTRRPATIDGGLDLQRRRDSAVQGLNR